MPWSIGEVPARTLLPPLAQIALAHYQFEAIHPFLDGNGRAGRLLVTLFLVERGILPTPLLYLSAFFEATRRDYYDGLRGVTERGEWNTWLEYFLNGVARQSEDALSRAQRINRLLAGWRRELRTAVQSADPVARQTRGQPVSHDHPGVEGSGCGIHDYPARAGAARTEGIVQQVSDAQRNRVYCAQTLLDILEEPPQLTPIEIL